MFLTILACWSIGILFMGALAFLLGYGAEAYNQFAFARSERIAFETGIAISRAATDPFGEGLWLTVMILPPLAAPVLFTSHFVTDGLLALQPEDYPFRRPLFRMLGTVLTMVVIIGSSWLVAETWGGVMSSLFEDLAMNGLDQAK